MAKQRGIHQISGKINNLCYYEQKYVRGGLIRRINEAMSERLKTDPVFANTRRANTIFGGCSTVASCLLDFFGNRNTFLFKPYRHALLTKAVSNLLVDNTTSLTFPSIPSRDRGILLLPSIIDGIVKNKIRNSFPELPMVIHGLSLNEEHEFVFTYQSLLNFCSKYKCNGVQISITNAKYIYSTGRDSASGSYVPPDYNPGGRVSYFNFFRDDPDEDMIIRSSTGDVDDAVTFWIIYATPILSMRGDRIVTGETGASCGLITFEIR